MDVLQQRPEPIYDIQPAGVPKNVTIYLGVLPLSMRRNSIEKITTY